MGEEKPESKAVSTTLYRIDYAWIRAHYLDQKYWKEKWKIFDYRGLTIELSLNSIDVRNGLIGLEMRIAFSGEPERGLAPDSGWSSSFSIPIKHDEYGDSNFQARLKGSAVSLIENLESDYIRGSKEYQEMKDWNDRIDQEARDTAEAFLDGLGYENEDVREAYVEWYLNKLDEEEIGKARLNQVISESLGHILTGWYCIFALYMEDKDLCESYQKLGQKTGNEAYEEFLKEKDRILEEDRIEYLKGKLTDPKRK
jgi:hypothetical protein